MDLVEIEGNILVIRIAIRIFYLNFFPRLKKGLVDLVNAETEMQRKQALAQMEGSLSNVYKDWRKTIIKSLANAEAYIDFYEEENLEDNILDDGKP